jgi:hypothetical protein
MEARVRVYIITGIRVVEEVNLTDAALGFRREREAQHTCWGSNWTTSSGQGQREDQRGPQQD